MEGEGMTVILAFAGVLALIIVAVVIWVLMKKRQSDYTYAYQK